MENIFNKIIRTDFLFGNIFEKSTAEKKTSLDNTAIIDELKRVRMQINCVQSFFNNECDFDMIDACVYELEALNARHRYLMKLIKENKIRVDILPENPAV